MPDQQRHGGLGGWYVAITFTPAGGDRFEEITGANIKRRFAIILDDKIESAPVIQTQIAGGHAQITLGAGDTESAARRSAQARAGAPLRRAPGAHLALERAAHRPLARQDAIAQGVQGRARRRRASCSSSWSSTTSRAGVVADIAVLFNLLLQLAVLATFGASMTLPGIAGLALTIGMAVDANVLINERIREELRNGKSPRAAVDAGYDKAFSAIIDGHVTTLHLRPHPRAVRHRPHQGLRRHAHRRHHRQPFTGVVCTRLVFDWWVRGRKVKTL